MLEGVGFSQYTRLVGCRLPPLHGCVSSFNNRRLWLYHHCGQLVECFALFLFPFKNKIQMLEKPTFTRQERSIRLQMISICTYLLYQAISTEGTQKQTSQVVLIWISIKYLNFENAYFFTKWSNICIALKMGQLFFVFSIQLILNIIS